MTEESATRFETAKPPTGAPNASHHGGKNSNCRRCVQNEGDVSRWCGRIAARDQPGTPDILVMFPLVSIDPQFSMSKKNNGRNPAVNTADRVAVQDALAELLVRLRRKELHCYNFIGNNNDSLMNVLECSPIMCGAVMCTAGILGLKKKKHEDCDVFFVRTDNQNGWDEMASRHCLADDVQRTPCKKSMFVRLGSVNPRAADALHDDGWMAFDMMVTVEQQFRLEMPPPRLNLTKACNAFLKSVAPNASVVGHAAMDCEINRQMLLEAQKLAPWWV